MIVGAQRRTWLEFGDCTADRDYRSGTFMSETIITTYLHVANGSVLPEMHIGATDSSSADMNQALVRLRRRDVGVHNIEVMVWVGVDRDVAWLALRDLRGAQRRHLAVSFAVIAKKIWARNV